MKNLNETNLLKATMTQPRLAFELIKALGKASEDLMTYERINSRPDRELARKSKLGEAVKYSSKVVGVMSRMERETGLAIIKTYLHDDAEKLEFMQDVDDFFNELYAESQEKQSKNA